MWGIDDPTAVTEMPAPAAPSINGYGTDGDAATNVPATLLKSETVNIIIAELQAILAAAGVTQNKSETNQVLTAIQALIAAAKYQRGVRVVTAAGAVTVTTADDIVVIDKTTGAATVVNLPAGPATGDWFTIKDGKGDAAANNITITPASGTIDGSGTLVMLSNYQAVTVVFNGDEWSAI